MNHTLWYSLQIDRGSGTGNYSFLVSKVSKWGINELPFGKIFKILLRRILIYLRPVSLISGNKFWLVSDRGGSFCWPWQELNYQWSIFLVRFYDFHDYEYFKPAIHQNWPFKLKTGVSIPKRDERQTR